MPKRDPRTDPKKFDMLLLGAECRLVDRVEDQRVAFTITAMGIGDLIGVSSSTLKKWRGWAKGAEVIHRAE